jgi:D-glycero-alpha-D-manno-heptose-7-phosphate kinase
LSVAKTGLKLLQKRKVDDFGNLLDQAWQIKKQLTDNVSNDKIDEMYHRAMSNGALGGKILGAGGGGYLLLYVQDKHKNRLLEAMKTMIDLISNSQKVALLWRLSNDKKLSENDQ